MSMFDNDVKEAINSFDSCTDYEFINLEDLILEAKEKDASLYKDLKLSYELFEYHQQQNEIFPSSEYLNSIKSDVVMLYKKYKNFTPIINSFMGFLCFYDKDYNNAKTYFLKDNNYIDAFFISIKCFEETGLIQDKVSAFNIAIKELEFSCREKNVDYIDYAIFKFVMDYSNEIDDFSTIINLIDIMYSLPFKKNQKFEDFYYSLIKISSIKNIPLRFLQSKDFFSKENFQTVCIQIKDALLSNRRIQDTVVISFDDVMSNAETLKKQNDFQGSEKSYREAINLSENCKQRQVAFKGIYNLYKNTDQVKMLSIINEFFDKDVFENDFFKYYIKSQMLIRTSASNNEIYENLNLLCDSLSTYERKSWHWNEPIIKCMELLKVHIQILLQNQTFNEAYSICKMGLALNTSIKKSDNITDNYIKFFSSVQTQCGKVKKDLAKKGTAKITEPTLNMELKKSNQNVEYDDLDNMPMFKFNPNRIFQDVSILNDEQYDYDNVNKKFTQEIVSKKIIKLVNSVEISHNIKSIYIKDNIFVGTPEQARSDINFYLNSNINRSIKKKRDEYLSFCKIIKDVIQLYGENLEYNITQISKKEYLIQAITYHSQCVSSEESKRYYLNVAELIRQSLKDIENIEFITTK